MARLHLIAAAASSALLTACPGPQEESGHVVEDAPQAKNLMMISVDTYRRDFLSRYGSRYGVTDTMDALAADSLVLDNHTSCSNWTLPSILCAANGRNSEEFGYVAHIDPDMRTVVPERPSLASWLQDEGFATLLFTPNGWLEGEWHHDSGYMEAVDLGTASAPKVWTRGRTALLSKKEETGAERWFLHLHFDEPHAPYNPPDEYLTDLDDLDPIDYDLTSYDEHQSVRWQLGSMSDEERELVLEHLRIRYVGQMEYFDDLFEEVLQSMEDEGFLDDTLLVLWTDHGEQFYERDAWGHAFGLYQEETGAVALFNHPEIEPQAWEGPTSHIDIAPTILHYLGIEQPEAITGHVAGTAPDNRVLLQVTSGQKGANLRATVGSLRMDLGYESGRRQAFDYSSDPDEIEDVCDLDASVDAALWTALEGYADTLEPLLVDYRRSATYKGCNGSD